MNQFCSIKNINAYFDVRAITEFSGGGNGAIYNTRVENKTNAVILSYVHLNVIAMAEMKYECSSLTKNGLYFDANQNRFYPG